MTLGVLASHAGTTLQTLIDACADGRIGGRIAVVVCNNSGAGAMARAAQAGIHAVHLSSATHPDPEALDAAIHDALVSAGVDVVFLAGYMKRIGPRVLAAFRGRVLNTHPSLLPKFGGRGMYGDRVFEAVLAARETGTGASVHVVDPEYDTGPVVAQARVPVQANDDLASLKARVQAREKLLVVETLAAIADGRLTLPS